MGFIYLSACRHLENLSPEWHLAPCSVAASARVHMNLSQGGLAERRRLVSGGRDLAQQEHTHMLDVLMIALGLGFFALAIGYSYACERL